MRKIPVNGACMTPAMRPDIPANAKLASGTPMPSMFTKYKQENKPVYVQETPNVPNDSLIASIVENHIGKPIVIDLWGVDCMPCMYEINLKEDTKSEDINYVYLTCPRWSSREKWETTIKDISGYHYYVSDETFKFILDNYQTRSIPFKLYFSKDGVLERTQVGAEI